MSGEERAKKCSEKRRVIDTELPHWIKGIDEEMKRRLSIKDKPRSYDTKRA